MKRILVFAYGLINYLVFVGVFLYLAAFLGNFFELKTIDSDPGVPLWQALLTNILLVGVFGVQHSVMARPAFKEWWTKFVPTPIERSTYVMFSNLAMILLFWQWQPMG